MDTSTIVGLMQAFRHFLPKVLEIAIREGMTVDSQGNVRKGGNLCLLQDSLLGQPFQMKQKIGEVPEGSRSPVFCVEKADRNRRSGHISSWVDRDVAADQYGGGVRFPRAGFVAAFSGLPEDADEAVVLVTANMLGFAGSEEGRAVLAVSGNTKFYPLLEVCLREIGS